MENENEQKVNIENKEEIKIDVQNIEAVYNSSELNFEVCQNKLLGNFDEKFVYSIREIIINELININKIISLKDDNHYEASVCVDNNNLEFVVILENLPDNKIKATLKFLEKLIVGEIYTTKITTTLKTFTDINTPDYLFKVKKEFHLYTAEEYKTIDNLKDYVAPPIETITEILRKKEIYKKLSFEKENLNEKYVVNVLKSLKNEPNGVEIIKKFVTAIKTNKLEEVKEHKMQVYKQILDKIIVEEIPKSPLSEKLIVELAEHKNTYLEEYKKSNLEYEKTLDTVPAPEKPKVTAKEATPTAPKPAQAPSPEKSKAPSSAGKGGDNKSGGGSEKPKTEDKGKTIDIKITVEKPAPKVVQIEIKPNVVNKPQIQPKAPVIEKINETPLNAFLSTFDTINNYIKVEENNSSKINNNFSHVEYVISKTNVTLNNGQVIQQTTEIEAKITNKKELEKSQSKDLEKE